VDRALRDVLKNSKVKAVTSKWNVKALKLNHEQSMTGIGHASNMVDSQAKEAATIPARYLDFPNQTHDLNMNNSNTAMSMEGSSSSFDKVSSTTIRPLSSSYTLELSSGSLSHDSSAGMERVKVDKYHQKNEIRCYPSDIASHKNELPSYHEQPLKSACKQHLRTSATTLTKTKPPEYKRQLSHGRTTTAWALSSSISSFSDTLDRSTMSAMDFSAVTFDFMTAIAKGGGGDNYNANKHNSIDMDKTNGEYVNDGIRDESLSIVHGAVGAQQVQNRAGENESKANLDTLVSAFDFAESYKVDAFHNHLGRTASHHPPAMESSSAKSRSNDIVLRQPRTQRFHDQINFSKFEESVDTINAGDSRRHSLLSISHDCIDTTDFDDLFNASIDICSLQAADVLSENADHATTFDMSTDICALQSIDESDNCTENATTP
jgi:hypothetical protein